MCSLAYGVQSAEGIVGQVTEVVGVATDGTLAETALQAAPVSSTPVDAPLTAAMIVAIGVAALFEA